MHFWACETIESHYGGARTSKEFSEIRGERNLLEDYLDEVGWNYNRVKDDYVEVAKAMRDDRVTLTVSESYIDSGVIQKIKVVQRYNGTIKIKLRILDPVSGLYINTTAGQYNTRLVNNYIINCNIVRQMQIIKYNKL